MSERDLNESFAQVEIHLRELQTKKRLIRLSWDDKVNEIKADINNNLNLTREGIGFGIFAFSLGESQGEVATDLVWLQTLVKLAYEGHFNVETVLLILSTKDEISRNSKLSATDQ